MKDLRTAFLVKYPKYEIILNMYSKANDCPATWENLSKDRKSTRLNSSHPPESRMPSSA